MSECNVCVEKFNKTTRSIIKCKCEYECCRGCAKTYLLGSTEGAHCMNCKVQWERKFLTDNFEKVFVNKVYKEHREQILYERELSLMPETQQYVDNEINVERLMKEEDIISKEILRLQIEQRNIKNEIYNLKNGPIIQEKRSFVRQCPNGDCRGFLSTSLKCGICELWACGECREVKGETRDVDHVCDKNILENVKMLEKDTKSCPSCSAMIFKINGCSQMYCMNCHTAFNWNTLRIEKGVIHNPHYFEYMRTQNNGMIERNPNDVICGREIDNVFIGEMQRIKPRLNENIFEIIRQVIHIRRVEMPRFLPNDRIEGNLDLRIKYMRDKIDENSFKSSVQKREKENSKRQELTNALGMFVGCMTDILFRLKQNPTDIKNILVEMHNLRTYTNDCFLVIEKSYNCKLRVISQKFVFK